MKRSTLGMDIFRHMTIFRLTVLLTFFLFAECAAGSCLSYGHSCWGAHGKRSGGNVGSPTYLDNNKLLLMRLMKQNAYSRGEINNEPQVIKEYENIPSREELQRFLNGVEQESNQMKGLNEYDSESDVLFDENQPMLDEVTANHLKPSLARRISSRILKKRSTKMD